MDIKDFDGKRPVLRLEEFFAGPAKGWGYTVGRFGGFQNSFTIDTDGRWDAAARTLSMRELYRFDDGHHDPLDWSIRKISDSEYEGTEASINGIAKGEQAGNAFHWQYTRNVPGQEGETTLGFDDWFWLIEPDVLCVSASMTKLGIEIARLSAFYRRLDGQIGGAHGAQG